MQSHFNFPLYVISVSRQWRPICALTFNKNGYRYAGHFNMILDFKIHEILMTN